MSIVIRSMQDEEADTVAHMVRALARDQGSDVIPKLTAAKLLAARDLIDVVVAEEEAKLLGACLWLMTYSTWRARKGIYIVDLYVASEARNRRIGAKLVGEAARRGKAQGSRFVKLEVHAGNMGAQRFYERLGFARHDDRLFILEGDSLNQMIE
jgi:ribosomal protein S18 acetylase RimI-like enzyme